MLSTPSSTLTALPGFQALDGCHCVTSSFRKVYEYNHYPISEEMLLGLGAGVGFIYWHAKGQPPFLGGRGNPKDFNADVSRRTGVVITERGTASPKVAEREMLAMLDAGQPVVIYADMPYLTYLNLPEDAHFGGHAVVVAGYDAATRQVLISDMAARETGYKKGTLNVLSMDQLAIARSSTYQPFPPHNHWFTFDFTHAHPVQPADALEAIAQAVDAMLRPPIQNLGVPGLASAAKRVKEWPRALDDAMLRLTLFNAYVFVEIGGSGGGLFRKMYSRFLGQCADLTGDPRLSASAADFAAIGERWSAVAAPLADAFDHPDPVSLIPAFAEGLLELHALEKAAWGKLK